ncbi:GMC family oxidoreductase [Verrucomicrobium sp. BvORR034]|jgi:choline dehydrogenase-like flavoprotein|uniref:GMC family oxidoreductase n=1 Tax=Verrucomicrobium sp. BvORR034 TaxID=1396418 RepID=UPI0006788ABC|nr:GMC family oxidoreductase [Verrucomicrobium sp. BvORR034]
MPLLTDRKTQPQYDVIVVGSGAGGGMAALQLSLNGMKVLMLEAGRNYEPMKETPMFNTPEMAPLRGDRTPDRFFGYYDATVGGGWQVPGEPYTNKAGTEGSFWWWRSRMLGGRTNHWGRISLRFGEHDFIPKSRDGLGYDWPIRYNDIAPWYDKAEMLIGVYGENCGIENAPDSSPGVLQPAPKPRVGDLLARKAGKKVGVPIVAARRAVLTKPMNGPKIAKELFPNNPKAQEIMGTDMSMRAPCFWATDCIRGCSIRANFQSTTVLIPPALQTGNLDIITDAMVREVIVGKDGRATGVHYIDKVTRKDAVAKARVVILAASTCETTRILMNSKGKDAAGLANASGQLGKNLMDSVGTNLGGHIPALENLPPFNEDGAGGIHVYTPWWLVRDHNKLGFARGYHIEMGGGRRMPSVGSLGVLDSKSPGVYGTKLKEDARRYYGASFGFSGRGEMVPNKDCYCELDPSVVDQWGIPVLRFHWKWSDHEIKQAEHMQQTFAELIELMGGTAKPKSGRDAIQRPGEIIHEVGTARMGPDEATSITNQYCQTWEVKNLFLMDGSVLPSNPDKNPTLTILALAWRGSEYLMEEMKRGNI